MSLEECGNCSLPRISTVFFLIHLILKMPNFPHVVCEGPTGDYLTLFDLICTNEYESVYVCARACTCGQWREHTICMGNV